MGALIAVVDKKGLPVSEAAFAMLEALSHRGSDAVGLASAQKVVIKRTLGELQTEEFNSNILVGHNFAKMLLRDHAQLIQIQDFTFIFDGRLFPPAIESEAKSIIEKPADVGIIAEQLIVRLNGAYAFAIAKNREIIVGRDPTGVCPLYFGENENACAVATERKALWRIGVTETKSFPPGHFAVLNEKGFYFKAARIITPQPILNESDIESTAEKLKDALLKSTKKRVSDVGRVAVAFSGGIDSSIIAFLTKLCQVDVHLVCVAVGKQKETAFAEHAAKTLDMPFHYVNYTIDDIKQNLRKVLWLIEESNPVNASIAIPIFWVAEQSAKLGIHVLLAGQGGDELFGGYHRYLEDYAKRGSTGLQKRLFQDVVSCPEVNFQRDNKICAFHKVELRLPFADWDVIKLALSIPANLEIFSPQDMLRKRALRHTARKLGIPKFIVEKPKRAIQYTTGVTPAMQKLAKREGLTLRKYVEKEFLETYKMLE